MCRLSMTAWSSQGLLAHYVRVSESESFDNHKFCLIDQTVPLSDPFYCQYLKISSSSPLNVLLWNANGTYLLLAHKNGFIEIFHQTIGLINQFKSVFKSSSIQFEPIHAIWCENIRKFYFNTSFAISNGSTSSNYTNTIPSPSPNSNSNSILFTSKSIHANYVPLGRVGFILITTNGLVHIFVENFDNYIDIEDPESITFSEKNCQIDLDGPLEGSGTFACQRSNGKIVIFAQTAFSWSIFELDHQLSLTGYNFNIILNSKLTREVQNNAVIDKFIWLDGKDSLVNLQIQNNLLHIKHLDLNFSIISCAVSKETLQIIPKNIGSSLINYSARASSYLFLQSTKYQILMLNFNGDILKTLKLEQESHQEFAFLNSDFELELNDSSNQIIISPNGLCVGTIVEIDEFPILIYSSIGEINPKNIVILREFLGKMISSTLNQSDSWDLFRVIQKTFMNLKSKSKFKSKSEDSEIINSFISTILAEWINLLDSSNIPLRDFYSKLLDLFRCLPVEFSDAYEVVDLTLNFLNIEKILLSTCNIASISMSSFEDSDPLKLSESDQISTIEPEILISLLPVLEEGLRSIGKILKANNHDFSTSFMMSHQYQIYALFPLNDEIFKSFCVIISTAQAAIKQFEKLSKTEKSPVNVILFYKQAEESLKQEMNNLNSEAFYPITPMHNDDNNESNTKKINSNNNNITHNNSENYSINFLSNLRSDPQIQSKCSKNLFLFLIEFLLDSQNLRKVFGTVSRIFSRYTTEKFALQDSENSKNNLSENVNNDAVLKRKNSINSDTDCKTNNYFYDSIKCLNLKMHENCAIYICRKCQRISSFPKMLSGTKLHTKKELIFLAAWQQNLWKSRCPCGSLRRIFRMTSK